MLKVEKGNRRKIICLVVCGFLLVATVFALRTKMAETLLAGREIAGVSFLYNDMENPTSGACPQIEADEAAMDELNAFWKKLHIRWHGFYGDRSVVDVPAYHLSFFDESGIPQLEMYITATGYLYCNQMTYSITNPSAEDVWMQLCDLYELADTHGCKTETLGRGICI